MQGREARLLGPCEVHHQRLETREMGDKVSTALSQRLDSTLRRAFSVRVLKCGVHKSQKALHCADRPVLHEGLSDRVSIPLKEAHCIVDPVEIVPEAVPIGLE